MSGNVIACEEADALPFTLLSSNLTCLALTSPSSLTLPFTFLLSSRASLPLPSPSFPCLLLPFPALPSPYLPCPFLTCLAFPLPALPSLHLPVHLPNPPLTSPPFISSISYPPLLLFPSPSTTTCHLFSPFAQAQYADSKRAQKGTAAS